LPLFWRGSCFLSLFFLCSLIGAYFFLCFLSIYLFSMTPLSFCKITRREISLELWSIYFWWMDGMFCVTPNIGVSMYMWVCMTSIMEAWKDSTMGHNNLAKLNGSQASICRRFMHWYQHMTLVGNMTIEELAFFIFKKKSSEISPYYEIEQINFVAPYHTSQHPRFGHKHFLPTKFYFRFFSQNIPTNSKRHRAQRCTLGSCKVLT
jgi:hypothetical protein